MSEISSRSRQARANHSNANTLGNTRAPHVTSRNNEQRQRSFNPLTSITEQALIAKERLLASVNQRLKQAIASNNKEDVKNFSKVIAANERTWKRMWTAPYVPSKPSRMPATEAISIQIDKLQAVVSRRIGSHIEKLDKQKIEPLDRKINTYNKLITELKKDQKKVGFLEGQFLGDTIQKDIQIIESIVAPLKKQRDGYVQKRRLLINDYLDFVSYLDEGRSTIGKLARAVPDANKIKMTPRPVRSVTSAFAAINEVVGDFKSQVIDLHKTESVSPAQYKAKLTKNSVETIEEEFNKLNFLGKFFAGDIGKDARINAKDASKEYAVALDRHTELIKKFNQFADTIKEATSAFDKGQPISFTLTTTIRPQNNSHNTKQQIIQSQVKINFSNDSIIARLGMDPEISRMGEFTRSNEGTPESEKRIHFPGYASGVTIGGGYDLGYKSKSTIKRDLDYVNKALDLAGKDLIPPQIYKKLINAAGLTRDRAKKYLKDNPELRNYKFDELAVDVIFHQYFKRETQTTERVVNKNITPYRFDDLPLVAKQVIIDTVVRGDFLSLRNQEKRKIFYNAIKEGIRTNNWDDFIEVYEDKEVFTLNPRINRHDLRAEKVKELESS